MLSLAIPVLFMCASASPPEVSPVTEQRLVAQASRRKRRPITEEGLQKLKNNPGAYPQKTSKRKSPAPTCAALQATLPGLAPLMSKAEPLRTRINAKRGTFSRWYEDAKALAGDAEKQRDSVQTALCTDDLPIGRCLEPVAVHCEGFPFSVDVYAWSDKKLSKAERAAVGLDLLDGPRNFANRCCGDFGCAEGAVDWPYENAAVLDDLLRAAAGQGPLAERARASVKLTAESVENAKCHCATLRVDKARVSWLQKAADKTAGPVGEDLKRTARALKKGLPEKECRLPGY